MSDITTPLERPVLTDEEKNSITRFLELMAREDLQILLMDAIATYHHDGGQVSHELIRAALKSLGINAHDGLSPVDYAVNAAPALHVLVKYARTCDREAFPEEFIPTRALVQKCVDIFWYIRENGDPTKVKFNLPTRR